MQRASHARIIHLQFSLAISNERFERNPDSLQAARFAVNAQRPTIVPAVQLQKCSQRVRGERCREYRSAARPELDIASGCAGQFAIPDLFTQWLCYTLCLEWQ